ncbi:hypothetical protein [Cellulomonas cellasea]|uniref:Uncharacterized protein n=1 Tax=Cellulomonas cellasea TaxID=43670 RepID=A0A7W4YBL9_9CELL|nr:hypothetical protein [Cellulomonas cellasea]MBB2923199.1 hypothetical protein [Cellulomonas cellasea]
MVTRRFDVEVPDGQHLGFSRDTDGAYRAHLFDDDTNRLVGHAELVEPDEDEPEWSGTYPHGASSEEPEARELTPEEIAQALEGLAMVALVVASLATEAAPHVRRWWKGTVAAARAAGARGRSATKSSKDQAVHTLRSSWGMVARTRKHNEADEYEIGRPDKSRQTAATSAELQMAFEDYRARMSSAEAQERFVSALLAKAFSEEQMRLLRSVTIDDDDGAVALGDVLEKPTPQQIGETVRFMLEKNPSLLDGDSLAALGVALGRGRPDRDPHPLKVRRVGVQPGPDSSGVSMRTSSTQAERRVER